MKSILYPYTKQEAIILYSRYYNCSQKQAKELLKELMKHLTTDEIIQALEEVETFLVIQARRSFLED